MGEVRYANMWRFMRESNYEDNDIGTDMRCTICKRILINAHSSVCGCRYCLECVRAYLYGDRKCCPGNIQDDCRLEVLDIDRNIHPDHAVNQRISRLIVACRYSCGSRCELRNIEEHERACERQPVNCPYINVGCTEMTLATDRVNEHLVVQHESHAKLLMECIDRLQSVIGSMQRDTVELRSEMREEMANLRNENNSLRAEIEKYRSEYLELLAAQGETRAQEMELLVCADMCRHIETKVYQLEHKTRREKEELLINIDRVDEEQTRGRGDMKKWVQKMEINVEMQNCDGEFTWRIDEWATKMETAREGTRTLIQSDAFYSHRNGYKMCLTVCPDGCGPTKGTYLAVKFHLMQGPFDNILPWPFKHAVTLSLIDQQTGSDYVSYRTTFDDVPSHPKWIKPETDYNYGLGYPNLIELAEFFRIAGLYQDDCVFIRCIVSPGS